MAKKEPKQKGTISSARITRKRSLRHASTTPKLSVCYVSLLHSSARGAKTGDCHQIVTWSRLILAIAYLFVRWIRAETIRQRLAVGARMVRSCSSSESGAVMPPNKRLAALTRPGGGGFVLR